jgi:hypothetical protein
LELSRWSYLVGVGVIMKTIYIASISFIIIVKSSLISFVLFKNIELQNTISKIENNMNKIENRVNYLENIIRKENESIEASSALLQAALRSSAPDIH